MIFMNLKLQKEIASYARQKVKRLFLNYYVPAHGFEHIKRVRDFSVKIAKAEKANIFLCELAAWLHDVGRTREKKREASRLHHELSYEICREWFKSDEIFKKLSRREKIILLYSVKYHWNNAADKYQTAYILRDADKLDAFGNIGNKRSALFFSGDKEKILLDMRLRFENLYNLRTETARKIVKEKKLFEPVFKFYKRILKEKIKPITL